MGENMMQRVKGKLGINPAARALAERLRRHPENRLLVQVERDKLQIGESDLLENSSQVADILLSQDVKRVLVEGQLSEKDLVKLIKSIKKGCHLLSTQRFYAAVARGILTVQSLAAFDKKVAHLEKLAEEVRLLLVEMFSHSRGSGHSGGSLSAVDLLVAVFLGCMYYDFKNPTWIARDVFVLSKGHAAPALYSLFIRAGLIGQEHLPTLRHLGSVLQGHPEAGKTPGIEISTGSLGQGLSAALGMAIAMKMLGRNSRVFCIIGDGEKQEGQISEAVTLAASLGLDNLVVFDDFNLLSIDGPTAEVDITARSLNARLNWWQANGWQAQAVDGHDIRQVIQTADKAVAVNDLRPHVIVAQTVKGKGISYMEDTARRGSPAWHGKVPDGEGVKVAKAEIKARLQSFPAEIDTDTYLEARATALKWVSEAGRELLPFSELEVPEIGKYSLGEMIALRQAAADFVIRIAQANSQVVTLGIDLSESVLPGVRDNLGVFSGSPVEVEAREHFVGLTGRHIQVGIAESNACGVAAGLSLMGFLPFLGSYEMFTLRMAEQIRNTLAPDKLPVVILGSHGGLGVGEDGRSHQPFEVLGIFSNIPGMFVAEPVDAKETDEVLALILNGLKQGSLTGPFYVRVTRQKLPVLDRPYQLRPDRALYTLREASVNPRLVIIANGVLAAQALEVANILEDDETDPIPTRVLTMPILTALAGQEDLAELLPPFVARLTMQDALTRTMGENIGRETSRTRNFLPAMVTSVGMTGFGESGQIEELYAKHYPIEKTLAKAKRVVAEQEKFNRKRLRQG